MKTRPSNERGVSEPPPLTSGEIEEAVKAARRIVEIATQWESNQWTGAAFSRAMAQYQSTDFVIGLARALLSLLLSLKQARAEVERVREAAFDDAEKSVREAVAAFCRSDAFAMSGPAGVGMAAVRAIRDAKSRPLLHPTGGRNG